MTFISFMTLKLEVWKSLIKDLQASVSTTQNYFDPI